jgi:hypothetical protein
VCLKTRTGHRHKSDWPQVACSVNKEMNGSRERLLYNEREKEYKVWQNAVLGCDSL